MFHRHRYTVVGVTIMALAMGLASFVLSASAQQMGTTLTETKTINPTWTQVFTWTIDKSVIPDTLDLFRGDSASADYTITVTKDMTETATLSGENCVTNGGARATEGLAIRDELTMPPSKTPIDFVNIVVSAELQPGETACYPYQFDISGNIQPGATYKVTGRVTITNHSGHLGAPFGPNTSASVAFPSSPMLINPVIHVDDTNGQSFYFEDDGSATYSKAFACDGDSGIQDNTATILETGQPDDATVAVNCYALEVSKDAHTSLTRTYDWSIAKICDQEVNIAQGQTATANCQVSVSAISTDSDWAVSGTITVYNPAPMDATLTDVSGDISGIGAVSVDCPSLMVPAGSSIVCTYAADLPDAADRTNTATASLQNTPSGTTGFSGSAAIGFADADVNEVDKGITVSDTYNGPLGAFSYPGGVVFSGSVNLGSNFACGDNTAVNTATFVTDTTGASESVSATILVRVQCSQGCSPGYWKNHPGNWGTTPPSAPLTSLFAIPNPFNDGSKIANLSAHTLLSALSFKGGSTKAGAAEILLRAAVAAYINDLHPNVNYPLSGIVSMVNAALASQNRNTMLNLASQLDGANNLGCPLN